MQFAKLLLISTLASIIPGQLIRISIFSTGAVTLTDILSAFSFLFFLVYFLFSKKEIFLVRRIFFPAILFMLSALASSILSLNLFSHKEVLSGSTFLLRFFLYFWLFVATYNLVSKSKILNWVNSILIIGFIFSLIGILQFLIFPDLSFLTYYGWDPHIKRITSSLLDPNFTGAFFTIFGSLSISLFLFKKRKIYLLYFFLIFVLQILTFSRSSYLSFLIMLSVVGVLKSPKVLVGTLMIFVLVFFSVPQAKARILGALTLDETSRARIQSWQNALKIYKDNPVFGIGFNNYRYAQAKYGFFTTDNPQGGHSGSGADSSLLLVLTTTGLVGVFFYVSLMFSAFSEAAKKVKESYLKVAFLSFFLGLVVHSQFVNSMFFPQISAFFWVTLGLMIKNDT